MIAIVHLKLKRIKKPKIIKPKTDYEIKNNKPRFSTIEDNLGRGKESSWVVETKKI